MPITKISNVGLLAFLIAGYTPTVAQPTQLSAQDIVDIRHLIDAYPGLLDNCINNGNDYADLFTDDATFGVATLWDRNPPIFNRCFA